MKELKDMTINELTMMGFNVHIARFGHSNDAEDVIHKFKKKNNSFLAGGKEIIHGECYVNDRYVEATLYI